ncbi:hypothetical protein FEM48_Zijuj02G0026200 [Ziziphus jujuba var. spinosa]|uniref:Protein NRT1/ PTR FAMILY 4.5-like n=1 Tax=Ziziphus jujuba var. spinosa TaxID=714518 RepID=A0A978VT47_ZIZJJ|nr:hypothetical protein FEM48_Zijuj02G0026200 [Ziziphus jujuba var. spinosa]
MESNTAEFGRSNRKGGFLACIFVFALGALENMGFVANSAVMVLYFHYVLQFDLSASANTLTNFMGSVTLLSLLGGFISDTYLNRLYTCLIFGTMEVLALMLVTIQAYDKDLHPKPCGGKPSCIKGDKAIMFYTSICLLALGAGGVKGALPTLGGDQFDPKDQKERKLLGRYFNWYLLSTILGSMVGVTAIVWVSMKKAWYWGFFIGTITALIGFIVLALGKPFYRFQPLGNSPIVRVAQVIAVAARNRKLSLPQNSNELYENSDKIVDPFEEKLLHTNQFRFLDKAAIVPNGTAPEPWKVCTVTQVEEIKILIRMLPIIASTIIMNTCLAQLQTFSVHQGYSMDPYIGSWEFPTASIPVIPLVFMSILIPIYEFFVVPFARKITGHPSGISQLQRVGVGLVLSIVSMSIAGIVEVKRRNKGIMNPISLFWLSFQYGIFGLADMFTVVGLLEFFYKEAPSGMKSLSTCFTWLSMSFGYFLSSIFVDLINSVTKRITPSKQGWLQGRTLDQYNLHLFYWFLAILSAINFANYLFWASWYKYKKDVGETGIEQKELSGLREASFKEDDEF